MRYLKKFSRIFESVEVPTKFDEDALEEVKMIFNDFAEDNDFYVYEWSLLSHPFEEVGIFYTYFSWIELKNKFKTNGPKIILDRTIDLQQRLLLREE